MGFSRQEYWSRLPFPSPGDIPNPGIKPRSPALQADALTSEPPGKPKTIRGWVQNISIVKLQLKEDYLVSKGKWASAEKKLLGNKEVVKLQQNSRIGMGMVCGWREGSLPGCFILSEIWAPQSSLLEPRLRLEALNLDIPRESGEEFLLLQWQVHLSHRKKGNTWQDNKSCVEFCESVGEMTCCSLYLGCQSGCQDVIIEYVLAWMKFPKRGKRKRIQSRAKTGFSPGCCCCFC